MKALNDILKGLAYNVESGATMAMVTGVAFDSRKVFQGNAFVAVKGTQVDGHAFIETAIGNGASVIVVEDLPASLQKDVTYVKVSDSAEALSIMAGNFYDNPSRELKLVGVTGTNGKSTIVTLLYELFKGLGYSVGLLSTIENKINDSVINATHTTPDAVQLNELMAQMINEGVEYCFMEASSHALHQKRTASLQFAGAIFTNLTHDHLDYHKSFKEYIAAKKLLFDGLSKDAFALINQDDKNGRVMVQNCKAEIYTYPF